MICLVYVSLAGHRGAGQAHTKEYLHAALLSVGLGIALATDELPAQGGEGTNLYRSRRKLLRSWAGLLRSQSNTSQKFTQTSQKSKQTSQKFAEILPRVRDIRKTQHLGAGAGLLRRWDRLLRSQDQLLRSPHTLLRGEGELMRSARRLLYGFVKGVDGVRA